MMLQLFPPRAAQSHTGEALAPVQRRLLPPLLAVLILLLGGFVSILFVIEHVHLDRLGRQSLTAVVGQWETILAAEGQALTALADTLIYTTEPQAVLRARDRQGLLAIYQPLFARLRDTHGVTHLYFHDPDRINLLRVHQPARDGDRIERFTAREASRTGRGVTGIELGPLGTFTLRAVVPVYADQALLGYLELGKEIEDVFAALHCQDDLHLAVTLFKSELTQAGWETGMAMLGRRFAWDLFADQALIYCSCQDLPNHQPGIVDQAMAQGLPGELRFKGRVWRLLVSPLTDATGREVGRLLLFHDITPLHHSYLRWLTIGTVFAVLLLVLLLVFLQRLLRRTDHGIQSQQARLYENEMRLEAITNAAQDGIVMIDREGRVNFWNPAAETLFGYSAAEIMGRDLHELLAPPRHLLAYRQALRRFQAHGEGKAIGKTVEVEALRRDGQEIVIALSLSAGMPSA